MRAIKHIVIHHAGVDQPSLSKLMDSINNNHKSRLHKTKNDFGYHIAYHYIIGVDWHIKPTRPIAQIGNHTANAAVNRTSIGIMLSWNFMNKEPEKVQIDRLIMLLSTLLDTYWYDIEIWFHKQYSKTSCPGTKFPYDLITNRKDMASKFKVFFEEEVKEPIFTVHWEKEQATIGDVKYLIEIAIHRAMKRLYDNIESTKDKSMWSKVFSFLKF